MTEEYPYLVLYDRNGEKGCSGPYEHYAMFETQEEAVKFYKQLVIADYDFSVTWKKLLKVETIEID